MPVAPWEPPAQVEAALKSLENQSLLASEVVVSCDGEPPAALVAVFGSTCLPIKLLVGPGGEGVGPALARGLKQCTEKLVLRADADDLSMPGRCALQVAAMIARPELVALSTPVLEFIDNPLDPVSERAVPVGTAAIRRHSFWRNPLNHPAVILRRDDVLTAGSYRDCPGFEDYELWLRLLRQGCVLGNLDKPLVRVRIGPDHLARRNGLAYMAMELRFLVGCGHSGSLSWPRVALMAMLRIPVRLLPASYQGLIMRNLLRRSRL
jgi:glycosyltransferase involved in cell wall biosynthesis